MWARSRSLISFELNIFDGSQGVAAGDADSPLRFFGVQWYPYGPLPFSEVLAWTLHSQQRN